MSNWSPNDRTLFWGVMLLWLFVGAVVASSDWTPHITSAVHVQESSADSGVYWYETTADIGGAPDASIKYLRSAGTFEVYSFGGSAGTGTFQLDLAGSDYIVVDAATNAMTLGFDTSTDINFTGLFAGIGGRHDGEQTNARPATSPAYSVENDSDSSAKNWEIYGDGDMYWGTNATGLDTNLYRSAANTLKTDDSYIVGTNLAVDGEFTDARQTIFLTTPDTGITADRYLSPQNDSAQGWVASRAGAVVGIGGGCRVAGIPAGSPTFVIHVRKEASATNLLSTGSMAGGTTGWKDSSATQTRAAAVSGSDTFSAGETLKCYIDVTIGGGESLSVRYCTCAIDVQLDS